MPLKRGEVYVSLYASTQRTACADAWKAGLGFFAWAGKVFYCLGNGKHPDDWCDARLDVKELVP